LCAKRIVRRVPIGTPSGTSAGNETSVIEQNDLVRKPRGQIKIVHHADCDHVRRVGNSAHLFHEIDLMRYVEKGQRLIKKKIAARCRRSVFGSSSATFAPQLGE